jgi:hypothetical protein
MKKSHWAEEIIGVLALNWQHISIKNSIYIVGWAKIHYEESSIYIVGWAKIHHHI